MAAGTPPLISSGPGTPFSTLVLAGRRLRGKAFYNVGEKVYCQEDFLVSQSCALACTWVEQGRDPPDSHGDLRPGGKCWLGRVLLYHVTSWILCPLLVLRVPANG